ncbi:winged helix-turn-helix domain-containing protein [Paenibacillus sp. LHD-117]|uniref:winged helix-turn-helix domain-containing protein n=1 Tax=Paenibacillus sp. LHD-117 TaxID=3071412 RepID=UPI0027E030C0|nr:winged helix-turn-helix domain-containing protein [Paenibacillus sp. LHD-117]MDQ6418887.1 winged helix-turn-helix domain-containing protein [Paenibacillus sp. LHD-117]
MQAALAFDRDKLTVSYRGQEIVLLPKEYTLLDFLCLHESQTFSREQLLNAVWELESPVDRTVDDHIYRLRKKLTIWESDVRIETVRGVGYRFTQKRPEPKANPLHALPSFAEEMRGIADMYLRYGRGDALLTLYKNKEMLGFDVDPGFGLLIRAMEGDVRFAVDPAAGSIRERAFLLLYLYQHLEPEDNRPYIEAALRARSLPPVWQNELETMMIVQLQMDWGEYVQASARLEQLTAEVHKQRWEGLIPYCANLRLAYSLHAEEEEAQLAALRQAELELERYPYMREEGQLFLLKGLLLYRTDPKVGEAWMERGRQVLQQS